MKDITIVDEKIVPHNLPADVTIHRYTKNQAFMFGGEEERITFRCEMRILDQVIDFFGEGIEIKPIDKQYFQVIIYSSIESMRFWLLQYITAIDEIRPKKLNEIVVKDLEDALERNNTEINQSYDKNVD